MSKDLLEEEFNLDSFVSEEPPLVKQEAPEEYDINSFIIEPELSVAVDGKDGEKGLDGSQGPQGPQGEPGLDGRDGIDGLDGKDGVSVEDSYLDDRDHLIIRLTDGKRIDVGDVRGPQGLQGPQGVGGGGKSYRGGGYKPDANTLEEIQALSGQASLFIQNTAPETTSQKYIWIETGIGDGCDFSFWFTDPNIQG